MKNQAEEMKEISNVIQEIFITINKEEKEIAKNYLKDEKNIDLINKVFTDNFNVETYNIHINYPHNRLMNGVLKEKGIKTHEAIFLITKYPFVKSHIESLIRTKEDEGGCADKSRRIMKMYYHYFENNVPIIESLLPKKILNTSESVLEYFQAIYSLYHGQSISYIKFMTK